MKRLIAIIGLFIISLAVREHLHAQDDSGQHAYSSAGTHSAFVSTNAQAHSEEMRQLLAKNRLAQTD